MSRLCKVDQATNQRLAGEAVSRGDNKYISVNPCKLGHLMRYTANHQCVDCKLATARRVRDSATEEAKEKQRAFARRYINKRYATDAEYRESTKKRVSLRSARQNVIKQADKLLAALAKLEAMK